MNTLHVHGRVGQDATIKTVGDQQVAEFSLADRRFSKGEEVTQWWRVSVWGRGADFASKLTKGDYVIVNGTATARAFVGKDGGEPKVSLELSANSVDRVNMGGDRASSPAPAKGKGKAASPPPDDDSIPF